jgi:hypothetical protein
LPLQGNKFRLFGCPARSLVAIPIEIVRFYRKEHESGDFIHLIIEARRALLGK